MNRLARSSRLIAAAQITARRIGDSQILTGQNLSADTEKGTQILVLEVGRKKFSVTQDRLAGEAGISESTYRRLLRDPERASLSLINRLADALRRLRSGQRLDDARTTALIEATYGGFLVAVSPMFAVTAAQVRAAAPQLGATANREWLACAHARQAALYLTNTTLGVSQRALARTIGLTEAAVCFAIRDVEERRSVPDFDRGLDKASLDVTGRML